MKYICIKKSDKYDELIIGKSYEGAISIPDYIWVWENENTQYHRPYINFISLAEWRDKQIDEICQ